jgi:hypothetical protein
VFSMLTGIQASRGVPVQVRMELVGYGYSQQRMESHISLIAFFVLLSFRESL